MNHVFRPFISKFVAVYFNKIFVYSRSENDHLEHLRQLFAKLREQHLFENIKKCELLLSKLNFLGYLISKDGIKVDEGKIEAMRDWSITEDSPFCS